MLITARRECELALRLTVQHKWSLATNLADVLARGCAVAILDGDLHEARRRAAVFDALNSTIYRAIVSNAEEPGHAC